MGKKHDIGGVVAKTSPGTLETPFLFCRCSCIMLVICCISTHVRFAHTKTGKLAWGADGRSQMQPYSTRKCINITYSQSLSDAYQVNPTTLANCWSHCQCMEWVQTTSLSTSRLLHFAISHNCEWIFILLHLELDPMTNSILALQALVKRPLTCEPFWPSTKVKRMPTAQISTSADYLTSDTLRLASNTSHQKPHIKHPTSLLK